MLKQVIFNSPTFFLVGISTEDTNLLKEAMCEFNIDKVKVLNKTQDVLSQYDGIIVKEYAFVIVDIEVPEAEKFVKEVRCNKDYNLLRVFGIRDLRKFDLGRIVENAGADFVMEKYDDWAHTLLLQCQMWLKATTEERNRFTIIDLILKELCMN